MRQNLFTCCRCGAEQRTAENIEDAPLGWARVTFERDMIVVEEGDRAFMRKSITTHACKDCGDTLLAFLERAARDVDRAFDDGGVS